MKRPANSRPPARSGDATKQGGRGGSSFPRETLEGVRRREPEALSEFFESSFDRVYGLAFRLLGDRTAAEDAAQEVFLRIHRSAHTLDPERDPLPWITTIAYNVCLDHWRSFGTKLAARSISFDDYAGLEERITNGRATPEGEALATERERLVQEAIMKLPEGMRIPRVRQTYADLPPADLLQRAKLMKSPQMTKLNAEQIKAFFRLTKTGNSENRDALCLCMPEVLFFKLYRKK